MAGDAGLTIKISSSPELVSDLERLARASEGAIQVRSAGPSQDASRLRLGLGDVATIVAILNGTATLAKLAYGIYEALKKKRAERITVQTALRTVEILPSDAPDEQHVRALLESAIQV